MQKLLFDENISQRLVEFINGESNLARMAHIRQRGWSGLPDTQWIKTATEGGFVIVTGDRNERTRGYTVADLKAMGARVILLGQFWDHLNRWERAKWLVRHIERIIALAESMPEGAVYLVNKQARARSL
ncbi:MAG: DUF5615 family PIN-like protein [Fimbriimonadales bacterium]|nr:DUF5615 family PIN-like protein [Fimbriimonadales bacterium]